MGPFVNSVACLQKDHKKYPNLFCFVWLVNPEDSEKGLDIFWVWISQIMKSTSFHFCLVQYFIKIIKQASWISESSIFFRKYYILVYVYISLFHFFQILFFLL